MMPTGDRSERFTLIYSRRFAAVEFGVDHPFQVQRYRLSHDLMAELGLLDAPGVAVVEAPLAAEAELLGFHRADYLATLAAFSRPGEGRADFRFGLGDVENPVFPGLYDWARLGCGGSLEALRQVLDGGARAAFNPAGGYHHAQPARASGFSYLNDAVVTIGQALARGLRVAYLDLDAHHGDGVQQAFYASDRVLTISLHESGRDFYPQTGSVLEMGEGAGFGYAVNVPLLRHADDLIFEQAFNRVVLPLLASYQPDLLVTQMGVDGLRTDPLTRLEFTTGAVEFAARSLLATGLPWVILGGGGYDQLNVARSWALLWGTVIGATLPDRLPPRFAECARNLGGAGDRLRDRPHLARPGDFARAQRDLDKVLGVLERRLLPLHRKRPGGEG